MQTDERMSYSCSLCFSDQFSYKILCISIYGSKDMIYASLSHFLEFLQNREKEKSFLTQAVLAAEADCWGQGLAWLLTGRRVGF
jgi:hypothetical protein